MIVKEDSLKTNGAFNGRPEDYTVTEWDALDIDDEKYMRIDGRYVDQVIDDYSTRYGNESLLPEGYYFNEYYKITLLPRLEIDGQLLLPGATCSRLESFKQTIKQNEEGEEVKRNYVPSSVLTEIEFYLRSETIWTPDKKTERMRGVKRTVKESDYELGGVEALDVILKKNTFENKDDVIQDLDDKLDGESESGLTEDPDEDNPLIELTEKEPGEEDSYLDDDTEEDQEEDPEKQSLIDTIKYRYQNEKTEDGNAITPEVLAEDYDLTEEEILKYVADIEQEEEEEEEVIRGKIRKSEWQEETESRFGRMLWYYE